MSGPAGPQEPPPRVDPADEAAHRPGAEPLWSESWYWDFVDPAQRVGGWIRLGLVPNQGVAWINAVICGRDIPTVALLDFTAPTPPDPNAVTAGGIEFRHTATVPLQEYRVEARGPAASFDNPAALLAGEPGRPAELGLDLTWVSSGTPFAYRITTRYEIPCAVSGTLDVDGRPYRFTAVPGQRDHSHGVRDWWGMDWVWSAVHLDDGTHLHGVDLQIPGMAPVSVGYVQSPGHPLVETTSVAADSEFADDGLPLRSTLVIRPGPVTVIAETIGHAPVRLVSPEGRVSLFPRAWVAVRTDDGRSGVGWLEWNRNLSGGPTSAAPGGR